MNSNIKVNINRKPDAVKAVEMIPNKFYNRTILSNVYYIRKKNTYVDVLLEICPAGLFIYPIEKYERLDDFILSEDVSMTININDSFRDDRLKDKINNG